MYIFLKDSGANGCTKWSDARQRKIDKDPGAGDTVLGADPDLDGRVITPPSGHVVRGLCPASVGSKQIVIALDGPPRPRRLGDSYGLLSLGRGGS